MPVCRFFANGSCRSGKKCRFAHTHAKQASSKAIPAAKRQRQRQQSEAKKGPTKRAKPTKSSTKPVTSKLVIFSQPQRNTQQRADSELTGVHRALSQNSLEVEVLKVKSASDAVAERCKGSEISLLSDKMVIDPSENNKQTQIEKSRPSKSQCRKKNMQANDQNPETTACKSSYQQAGEAVYLKVAKQLEDGRDLGDLNQCTSKHNLACKITGMILEGLGFVRAHPNSLPAHSVANFGDFTGTVHQALVLLRAAEHRRYPSKDLHRDPLVV